MDSIPMVLSDTPEKNIKKLNYLHMRLMLEKPSFMQASGRCVIMKL